MICMPATVRGHDDVRVQSPWRDGEQGVSVHRPSRFTAPASGSTQFAEPLSRRTLREDGHERANGRAVEARNQRVEVLVDDLLAQLCSELTEEVIADPGELALLILLHALLPHPKRPVM
jgi:hypothetical protein